jgi:hypothetical protein
MESETKKDSEKITVRQLTRYVVMGKVDELLPL